MTEKKEPSRAMNMISPRKKKKKTEKVATLTHATARVKLDTVHETGVNKVIKTNSVHAK